MWYNEIIFLSIQNGTHVVLNRYLPPDVGKTTSLTRNDEQNTPKRQKSALIHDNSWIKPLLNAMYSIYYKSCYLVSSDP